MPNALPFDRPQRSALLSAAALQLGWGLRAVAREIHAWRDRAAAIPDRGLRRVALSALDDKRGHADGAALFWTLPRRHSVPLLQTLVRYELLQDLLDSATERDGAIAPRDGERLYRALGDALDPEQPPAAAYLPRSCDDGGYVTTLVEACREGCRALPGYGIVRPLLLREADRAGVLILNHRGDAVSRDAALRTWAERHLSGERELLWFERTAAASGWITTHALLAAAADEALTPGQAAATHTAYFPWLALALTLLDSYADAAEDRLCGDHSYVDHYATTDAAVERLCECIARASNDVLALRDGTRHGVLLGSMIALYLSKDSARSEPLRGSSARIAAAGGTLPRLLLPVLRTWRVYAGQRRTT